MSDTPTYTVTEPTNYLDVDTLQALGNLPIAAKALAEGIIDGMHRSPTLGSSVEFAEYIEYAPGHEIRHIDWRIYAKSDKYYVKQFEEETNLRVYMVLDGSGSMDFASEDAACTKLKFVSYLAAALSYLFIRQSDAVGALSFDAHTREYLPASTRSSHLNDLFMLMDQLRGAGDTNLDQALMTLSERARSGCMFIIFSDMLSATEETLKALQALRSRRYDVVIFHAVDPAELNLPFEGLTLFEGLEDEDEDLLVDPDDLRDAYMKAIQQHMDLIQTKCHEGNMEYIRFVTTEPVEEVALRFLRSRRGGKR